MDCASEQQALLLYGAAVVVFAKIAWETWFGSPFGDEDLKIDSRGGVTMLLGKGLEDVEGLSELIFIGTGSSSGTPSLGCIMESNLSKTSHRCLVCSDASSVPGSKNARANPSMLVRYRQPGTEGEQNILIDVGKTFKQACSRHFLKYQVSKVHSIILTHEHSDAILGLDDIRELSRVPDANSVTGASQQTIPVYLNQATRDTVGKAFHYLMKKPDPSLRKVSQVDWKSIHALQEFSCCGLEILPVPLEHGRDCTCFGFIFGKTCRVAYLSDLSSSPSEYEDRRVWERLTERHIELLVIDAVASIKTRVGAPHIGLPTAIEIAKELRPTKTLCIGMSHGFKELHNDTQQRLRAELKNGLDIQLAHDGQRVFLAL